VVGVLYSSVRVKDQAMRYDPSGECHPERVCDRRSPEMVGDRVPDDPPRTHVFYRCQIQPALGSVDVGNVRYPHFVRPIDVEILIEQIRRSVPVLAPDGRVLEQRTISLDVVVKPDCNVRNSPDKTISGCTPLDKSVEAF